MEKSKSKTFYKMKVNYQVNIVKSNLKFMEYSPEKKKRRTKEQTDYLVQCYNSDFMPTRSEQVKMAKELGLELRIIRVWFQNRRAKDRANGKIVEIPKSICTSKPHSKPKVQSNKMNIMNLIHKDSKIIKPCSDLNFTNLHFSSNSVTTDNNSKYSPFTSNLPNYNHKNKSLDY